MRELYLAFQKHWTFGTIKWLYLLLKKCISNRTQFTYDDVHKHVYVQKNSLVEFIRLVRFVVTHIPYYCSQQVSACKPFQPVHINITYLHVTSLIALYGLETRLGRN